MSILSVGTVGSPQVFSGSIDEYVPPVGFLEVGSTEEAYANGFIDWLRKDNRIVGVAITPFGSCDGVLHLNDDELVELEDTRVLFFFGSTQSFERSSSADQELRPTRCFQKEERWIVVIELSGWGVMPELSLDKLKRTSSSDS